MASGRHYYCGNEVGMILGLCNLLRVSAGLVSRDARHQDIPKEFYVQFPTDDNLFETRYPSALPTSEEISAFGAWVNGETPVALKMYNPRITYAYLFERCDILTTEMDFGNDILRELEKVDASFLTAAVGAHVHMYVHSGTRNPFKIHLVEVNLRNTKHACN